MKCKFCGIDANDGDSHGELVVRSDGAIIERCRWTRSVAGDNCTSIYRRVVPMPNQRIYFSKILDPDSWN